MRKPFQGILNIIRFNWHFYLIAFIVILILFCCSIFVNPKFQIYIVIIGVLAVFAIVNSLLVSYYVYDVVGIYNLNWIEINDEEKMIVNINAGFDETSDLLQQKFAYAKLIVLDFYDKKKHTEISIERARKAYPPYQHTLATETTNIKIASKLADKIFLTLAAHEIRNEHERNLFFKELHRILQPKGQIYVTEHLRDLPNFLAFTIGFLHFYSKKSWINTFAAAHFKITKEIKLSPFISTFILEKHGNSL